MTWEVPPLWPNPRWSIETTPYPASVQRFACAALVIRDPPHPCPSSSTGTLRLAEAPAGLKMVKQILTGVREPGSGALAMQRFATLTALPPEPAAAISAPPGEAVLGGATSRELMSTVPTAAVRARTTAGRRDTLLLGWRRLLTPTAPDRFGLRPDGWRRCGRRSRVGHIRAIAHPRGALLGPRQPQHLRARARCAVLRGGHELGRLRHRRARRDQRRRRPPPRRLRRRRHGRCPDRRRGAGRRLHGDRDHHRRRPAGGGGRRRSPLR